MKPDYAKLAGPVLGLFAEKDGFVTPAGRPARSTPPSRRPARRPRSTSTRASTTRFFNDERPDVYNKAAADDAWRRTLALFRQHLK